MTLRWPNLPAGAHVRTCQECDHAQTGANPATLKSDSWRDAKCRRCKSEGSLDYGSENTVDTGEWE